MAKTDKQTGETLTKRPFDIRAIELIEGPPATILTLRNFRSYQGWMSEIIYDQPFVFLGAEMGLGKTGAVLRALVRLMNDGIIKKPLIVAPLKVAEDTWPDEIATWDFSRHLTYRVVTGDVEQRIAALEYPADVTIINRENIVWLQEYLGSRKFDYDMLIYDEASRLKSGSKRTKPQKRKDGSKAQHSNLSEFGILRQMRFRFKKVVELSGTPAPNGLVDLWGPIFIGDLGKRLETSRTKFLRRWFYEDRYAHTIEPRHGAEEEIMERISDVFFSLREEDYLTLPPMLIKDHYVDMPAKAMLQYRRFEKDFVLEEFDLEAVNGGVLTNKLLQFANGSLYTEKTNEEGEIVRNVEHVHDAKLDVLESIMAEAMGRPVLMAYSFQFDMERIKKRFPFVRVFGEGTNDTKDWNAGKFKLMLTHPASAGHGLNFQHGGNVMVWYGLTWSLELYQQFIKRLHRSGQKAEHVLLHRILTRGTVDERVVHLLGQKGMTQDRITEAVRLRVAEAQRVDEYYRMAA